MENEDIWRAWGELIRTMFDRGEALFSIRSPGGVAELYPGSARKMSVDGASFTIERDEWHLHFRLDSVERVRFQILSKEGGGIRMAVVFENKDGTPVLRAGWLPRLMPPEEDPGMRFWEFSQSWVSMPGFCDERNRELVFPGGKSAPGNVAGING